MDYALYVDLLQNLLPSNTPPPDSELVLSASYALPTLPMTERQQLDLQTLTKIVAERDDKGVIVLCNSPCYVLYLLACLPLPLDTRRLLYPFSAYLAMVRLYQVELQRLQQNMEYFAYAARLYFMTLHHRPVFQDLDEGNRPGGLPVTVNDRPSPDALNIVTYDSLALLMQHDTREILWRSADSLSLLRDYTLCDLSSPALPDFVHMSPERFVRHSNSVSSLRLVSPDTHDYSDFASWLNPHQLPALTTNRSDNAALICLVFPASADLDTSLTESYVHREILNVQLDMTIAEYVMLCLTTLFLAEQRQFELVVDCQWLRQRRLPLFDEQPDDRQSVLAVLLRSLCRNLVVTVGRRDDEDQTLLRVEQDTLRWQQVRDAAALDANARLLQQL